MNIRLTLVLLGGLLLLPPLAQSQAASETSSWERSVVTVEATRKDYDYLQPWSTRLKSTLKSAVVVESDQVLTTADELHDRTLIRVQRGGRGKWWTAQLAWIDYHANLALITVPDSAFWRGLVPVELADPSSGEGNLQIVRWRQGRLDARRADFNQFAAHEGRLSFSPRLQMEVTSEIQGAGAGEPLVSKSKIQGLVASQEGNTCTAIPSAFIAPILKARKEGSYHGLGYFDFVWTPAENPATLSYLKLPGDPRGVLVINIPFTPGVKPVLMPKDVLLNVDGFDIGIEGDYQDPDYGPLSLENLATRRKWAGDQVKLELLRDGKIQNVTYRLPKAEYKDKLVPDQVFDHEPEYVVAGGLVFQPLTDAFLHSWGPDWKRRSPFRLYYYNDQDPTPERPGLVVLSQVLPDSYNLGYQDQRFLVVDKVNGVKISRLEQLREALTKPVNGYDIIKFMQSDSLQRIVLAADNEEQATKRVLSRYGISREYFIADEATVAEASALTKPSQPVTVR